MAREEKQQEVRRLAGKFQQASIAILTEYRGLKAGELSQLRSQLKQHGDEMIVAKNSLAIRSLEGRNKDLLEKHLVGPTAIIFGAAGNPIQGAKVIAQYAEEHELLVIKKALLDGKVLERADVIILSKLPGREELLAKLVGSMAAPATNLVRSLNGVAQKLVTVIKAIHDQKAKGGS